MLEHQSYRTLPSPFEITEFELKVMSIEDPWSKHGIPGRIHESLKDLKGIELLIDTRRKEDTWGMQLEPHQLLIHLDPFTGNQVRDSLKNLPMTTQLLLHQ